jgi:dsDNA-specific endonuclease/ATPase MutS2
LGSVASIFILGISGTAAAQQQPSQQQMPQQASEVISVGDDELRSFVSVVQTVQSIKNNALTEMRQELQERDLNSQRFHRFMQQQQGNGNANLNLSQQEQQKFQQARNRIRQIGQQAKSKIRQAVRDKGLEVSRFQEIFHAVRQNRKLRDKAIYMMNQIQHQMMDRIQHQQNVAPQPNSNSNSP